jgi:hypothetical protein
MSRREVWLDLLRDLSRRYDGFIVWKGLDEALDGYGDVDAALPHRDWNDLEAAFGEWAMSKGLGPVVSCRHIPGSMLLLAVEPGTNRFFELDVKTSAWLAGARLWDADALLPLAKDDERGFRRLSHGAEGVFRLVLNGLRKDGRADAEQIARKQVRELLVSGERARDAARLFGRTADDVMRCAHAVRAGGWDEVSGRRIRSWARRTALLHPFQALRRARFRLVTRNRCPVIKAVRKGELPTNSQAWLVEASKGHASMGVAA